MGVLRDAHAFEQGMGARARISLLAARGGQAQHGADDTTRGTRVAPDQHILQRGHLGKQADVLEGARQPRLQHLMRLAPVEAGVIETNLAMVDRIQPGERVEQRGLARAVGPDEAVNFARVDLQRNVGQRLQAAKRLANAGNGQQRHKRLNKSTVRP
ncbi:MAG: hypothetical protein H6R08_1718 [Proteobacteria bacterium]|nr:hypothetical protein [Pseudomonadota bacterium]